MGAFDRLMAKANERREAKDSAARRQAEAEAAKQAEGALDPAARIEQPEWVAALTASGVESGAIQAVLDGNGGTIYSPASGPMPSMRRVDVGAVVLAGDRLAYALRGNNGVEVLVRRRSEVDQMRKANMDGSVWVVFENDRSFPDRGNQTGRADSWEIRAPNHDPNAIRTTFIQAGYSV
ncbi:MAG: hypothetical protein QOE45_265 [Frankiaceae bacterium]|jgi:hypothetical protein|nr:hypothetical protein [Frankiaceae bacterium]